MKTRRPEIVRRYALSVILLLGTYGLFGLSHLAQGQPQAVIQARLDGIKARPSEQGTLAFAVSMGSPSTHTIMWCRAAWAERFASPEPDLVFRYTETSPGPYSQSNREQTRTQSVSNRELLQFAVVMDARRRDALSEQLLKQVERDYHEIDEGTIVCSRCPDDSTVCACRNDYL